MTAQLRSELHKVRSTRTFAGLLAALLGLVVLAVLLHAFGLSVAHLSNRGDQRGVLVDVGVNLGAVFAGLLGALSITGEFRSGTIRPTLLFTPRRDRVIAAKTVTALLGGLLVGVLASGVAAGVGAVALAGRGVPVRVGAGDFAVLIAGGGAAAALWAVIGLGVGAVVRAQVPAVIGLFTWLLFVENLLADLPSAHRFAPGALAQALAGQRRDGTLHTPAIAAVLLALYAAAAIAAGRIATMRRDVA
jgi:ABC-type transport system involved in multi-copper enzyme maturation permease subunit